MEQQRGSERPAAAAAKTGPAQKHPYHHFNRNGKRSQHDDNGSQHGDAKRQRVSTQQSRQQYSRPPADGLIDTLMRPKATAPRERRYCEVQYKGKTRAVVGPGGVVREMLLADECVSFRVSASVTPAQAAVLREAPADGDLVKALLAAKAFVDFYDVNPATSTTAATPKAGTQTKTTTVTYSGNVYLTGKDKVAAFMRALGPLEAAVSELKVEAFNILAPLQAPWTPRVLKTDSVTSYVSVTWATGLATGGARRLTFATPSAANAFVCSSYDGQLGSLLKGLEVNLVGSLEHQAKSESAAQGQVQTCRHSACRLPPLKQVRLSRHSDASMLLYDEEKIDAMVDKEGASFCFVAEINAGLPDDLDEIELTQLLRPHECLVDILRRANTAPETSATNAAAVHRLRSHLETHLRAGEVLISLEDTVAQLEGVRVAVSDEKRQEELLALFAQSSRTDKPCGQPVRVAATYELCATIDSDIRKCFREGFDKLQHSARLRGGSWKETAPAHDRDYAHVQLEALSRDTVLNLEAALLDCVEREPYVDSVLRAKFKTQREWHSITSKLNTAAQADGSKVRYRSDKKGRVLWVYGPATARREAVHGLRLESLSILHKDRPRITRCMICSSKARDPSIVLAACGDTFCVACIKRCVCPGLKLPLCCPDYECKKQLELSDVTQIVEDSDALLEKAVSTYVAAHADKYVMCSTPACHQVLPVPGVVGASPSVVACESCHGAYCATD